VPPKGPRLNRGAPCHGIIGILVNPALAVGLLTEERLLHSHTTPGLRVFLVCFHLPVRPISFRCLRVLLLRVIRLLRGAYQSQYEQRQRVPGGPVVEGWQSSRRH